MDIREKEGRIELNNYNLWFTVVTVGVFLGILGYLMYTI